MKRYKTAVIITASVFLLVLAVRLLERYQPVNPEVRKVVEQNIMSLEAGDLESYMDTLYPGSPQYESSGELFERIVGDYAVEMQILSFRQLRTREFDIVAEVRLRTILTPRARGGEPRTAETLHHFSMTRQHRQWKIADSKVIRRSAPEQESQLEG